MSAALVARGDAACLPLRDESVDLIVTSPPYFALRSYQDGGEHYDGQIGGEPTPQEFIEALWTCTREWWRVLKPSGSLFVNLGDKYAGSGGHNNAGISTAGSTLQGSRQQERGGREAVLASRRSAPDSYNKNAVFNVAGGVGRQHIPGRTKAVHGVRAKSLLGLPWRYSLGCIDGLADPAGEGWVLRAEIVWDKPNSLPESVKDRARRSHENWFHLTKQGSYFASMDELRDEPSGYKRDGGHSRTPPGQRPNTMERTCNPLGRLPGSVWPIATEPLVISEEIQQHYGLTEHFAAFPTEWPRRLILGWSPPDGTVLDPFGGTGTTAMVARALGRKGISLDLSADYCRLAQWRVFKSGHGAKALSRTWGERQGALAI